MIEQCLQYNCAIKQRETELSRDEGFAGTKGYENMGCYICKGLNPSCGSYCTQTIINKIAEKYKIMEEI